MPRIVALHRFFGIARFFTHFPSPNEFIQPPTDPIRVPIPIARVHACSHSNPRCLPGFAFIISGTLLASVANARPPIPEPTRESAMMPAVTSTTPGALEYAVTPTCVGFKWFVSGDDNLNATVSVSCRRTGASGVWSPAQPLLRVEPGSFNDDGVDPGNLLAGSILRLMPDTEYDVHLVLNDPDGGAATRDLSVRTRAIPADPVNARTRYVIPGTGGGSGTLTNPFRGIAAANAAAAPGDVFLLQAGIYTGVASLSKSGTAINPIVWRGVDPALVILDGLGTAKPVVDFPGSNYVHLENVTVRRPKQMTVRGTAATNIVVRDCILDSSIPTGYEMGGVFFVGAGNENILISDNEIIGPIQWEDGRNDDGYALFVVGQGHVVCFNKIHGWYDGMGVGHDEFTIETSNCDFYGNEVYDCTDDGIETDGSRHNIRIYDNRFTNVLCGVSCQPVYGGPVYIVRNVVYNFQLKPLKFHIWPTGLLVYGNTFVGADPRGFGSGQWRNTKTRNNLFLGGTELDGPNGDPIALDSDGVRVDLDYDGWFQFLPERFARFNGVRYDELAEFQDALNMSWHSRLVDYDIFVDAEVPVLGSYLGDDGFPPPYLPGEQDLRLLSGSVARDAGVYLANINDGYLGTAPDLGAYEIGGVLPLYGPRTGQPSSTPDTMAGLAPEIVAAPNPFRSQVSLRWDAPGMGNAAARIYSTSGRLLRTLTSREADGSGELVWDGRDATGRELAAGIYYVRMVPEQGGRPALQQKIVRVE